MYLQVARSTIAQHSGNDCPFFESFAIGFIGLLQTSASKDIPEGT
jgi:hypothetical protein